MLRILREEYDSFRRKSLESQSNMPEYDLTDSEIKVLVLLDMVTSSIKRENLFVPSEIPVKIIDRHLIGDFLEMISSDLQISEDVDKILNRLRDLKLVEEKKMLKHTPYLCLFAIGITNNGKKIAEKYRDNYFDDLMSSSFAGISFLTPLITFALTFIILFKDSIVFFCFSFLNVANYCIYYD